MSSHWHIRLFSANTTRIGARDNPWQHPNLREPIWRLYCNDGDGASLTPPDGERLALCAHEIYLLPAGVTCASHAAREVGHFYVHFDVLGVPRRTMSTLFARPLWVPPSPALRAHIAALWGVRRSGDDLPEAQRLAVEMRLAALLHEALAQTLAATECEALHSDSQHADVQAALDYIAAHLSQRITIAQLAAQCSLSEDYFIRRFRRCMGATPTRYIQEQRINAAAQHLAFSDDTIERIIQQTGFGSRYYFTRIFKRFTGRTPGSYRKSPPV